MKKDERKYYLFKYKIVLLNLFSFLFFIILGIITYFIYNKRGNLFIASTKDASDFKFYIFIIGMIIYLFVHEILHALSYIANGANPKNIETGIYLEKGVLYCSCKEYITRKNIMISSIVPFIVLSLIAYPLGIIIDNPYLTIFALFNFTGCVGDFALFNFLRKLPKDIEYREYDDVLGFCISSNKDISKIKSIGIEFKEVLDKDDKITKTRDQTFYISKISIIFLVVLFLLLAITLFYMIK